jgi:hypothetical protein
MRLAAAYSLLRGGAIWFLDRLNVLRHPKEAGATLYAMVDDKGTVRFLGSAFAYGSRTTLLTAAHCVKDAPCNRLFVCSAAEFDPKRAVRITAIRVHPKADLALLKLEREAIGLRPLIGVGPPQPGQEVVAHGFPEDTTPLGIRPIERHFSGVAQRTLQWTGIDSYSYDAIEVSFGSPEGLSGGSLCIYGNTEKGFRVYSLVGLMTKDRRASTYIETVSETEEDGRRLTETVHAVTKYGIAVDLSVVRPWIRRNLRRQEWAHRNPDQQIQPIAEQLDSVWCSSWASGKQKE